MANPMAIGPEIQRDYHFAGNTFVSRHKEPEVEVGDVHQANFYPQLKLKRWGNEANLSVRLLDATPGKAVLVTEGDRITWRKGHVEAHFYAEGWGVDGGAFEFEVVLRDRPPTNRLEFSIQSKELAFYYQPPLTQEERDNGAVRPDNVVGSYAVYHATRGNVHASQADAEKYRAGKAFHIYRPKVTDSAGSETWADLNIDPEMGTLTVSIDQAWLDAAAYPVVVDPNFGYETAGGASYTVNNSISGSLFTGAAGAGVSITAYIFAQAGAHYRYGLYLHSDSSLVTNGTTDEGTTLGTDWRTLNFTTAPTLSAVGYVVVIAGDDVGVIYYDTGDANQHHFDPTDYVDIWPDPASFGHWTPKYSIYCTYTVGGPEGQPTMIRTQGIPTGAGSRDRPGRWN